MIRSALPEAPLFFGLFAVTDRVKSDRLFYRRPVPNSLSFNPANPIPLLEPFP
jgi:hypothetical protein